VTFVRFVVKDLPRISADVYERCVEPPQTVKLV
jgi:hypothetical protein